MIIAIVAMPAMASAQGLPLPTIGLPLPTIGLPLPSIGLPLSAVATPPLSPDPQRPVSAIDQHRRSHWNGRRSMSGGWPVVVFVSPYPMYALAAPRAPEPAPPPAPPIEPPAVKGSVVFHVQPGSAQIFVDGYYAGTADDLNGNPRSLVLDAGPHMIDVSETGYDAARLDVKITSSEPIVYRKELARLSAVPPASSTPGPVYAISGCYLGNVPPEQAGLPPTCDLSRAIRLR